MPSVGGHHLGSGRHLDDPTFTVQTGVAARLRDQSGSWLP